MLVALETALRTLAAVLLLPPLLIGVSVGAIVQRRLGATAASTTWAYRVFSGAFLGVAGIRLLANGREHITPGGAYLVVSNHESNLDPFAIMHALPELSIRFVIKRQIMQIPIFGYGLRNTGNVTVDRRQGTGDLRRIQSGLASREPQISLLFFAEGTRSRDGAFREFKKGAFVSAISEQLPILPVAVAGTYQSLAPEGATLRRATVAIEVGEPIPTEGLKLDDRDALRDRVRAVVGELRAAARARVRAAGDEPGGLD